VTKPLQYYLLGKSADLAFGELSAIYQQHNLLPPIRLTPFFASGSLEIDCQEIINISGGVVKVFYALDYLDSNLEETIAADLIESGNSHFAVSSLSRNEDLKNIAI